MTTEITKSINMTYKNYNVLSPEIKAKIGTNLTTESEAIRKSIHYTKRVDARTIAQVLKAGATPNKFLFTAINKYYDKQSL